MITVVDYGSGNLRSVYNAFKSFGQAVKVSGPAADIDKADKIVLPGVGSSRDAMEGLKAKGYIEPLKRRLDEGAPFLGICLGLQLLLTRSEESGGCSCLGVIQGSVNAFSPGDGRKVPQIGWNTVKILRDDCPVLRGVEDDTYFYFVHSYYCSVEDGSDTAGITDYGLEYTSVLWKDNIFAVQFHPERSQREGMKIIRNFIEI